MAEIYILDELPIISAPPCEQQLVYVDVPTLRYDLLFREHGVTIYGCETPPFWSVSTRGYRGDSAYSHWMQSVPVSLLTRALAIVVGARIHHKHIEHEVWHGKAVVVVRRVGAEAHFLVYSPELDLSLDLNIEIVDDDVGCFKYGMQLLGEIVPAIDS